MVVHHFVREAVRAAAQAGGAAAIGAFLRRTFGGGADLPEHVVRAEDGQLEPEPGYSWLTETPGDYRVRWTPGKEVAQHHVVAGGVPGEWFPAPGYTWVDPTTSSIEVRWSPGSPHGEVPHVVAGPAEGRWRAAPGYCFVTDIPGDLRVTRIPSPGSERGPSMEQVQRIKDLATLGLDEAAGRDSIDAAFRRLVKLHHPDRFVSAGADAVRDAQAAFTLLRQAYERLRVASA